MADTDKSEKVEKAQKVEHMDKVEKIGFHKGALDTLVKEREELARIIGIVDQIMQIHAGRLKELGVDVGGSGAEWATPKGTSAPIDDLL